MANMVAWRAWYSGRRTYSSATSRWSSLPSTGAQGFVEYEDTLAPDGGPTRRIVANGDYYWLDPNTGRIEKTHTSNIRNVWADPPGVAAEILKAGEWVEDAEYDAVVAAMVAARRAP